MTVDASRSGVGVMAGTVARANVPVAARAQQSPAAVPVQTTSSLTTTAAPRSPMPAKALTFVATAQALFPKIDRNADGHLSKGEIQKAFQNPAFVGRDAAALVALKDHRDEIQDLSDDEWGPENDGVTRADLSAYAALPKEQRTELAERGFDWAVSAIPKQTRTLFPQGLQSITPGAVVQGSHGDCYLLSAIAGLAAADPKAISDMIVDNGNNTFTVKFPGRSVTIDAPSAAEMTAGAETSPQSGMWVAVLEKAYFKYDPLANLGGLTGGIKALTGKSASTFVAVKPFSTASIVKPVQDAQRDGRLMVASRTWSKNGDLPGQHVYTVMGYDAKSGEIIIRNPHGSGGPAGDGIHRLSPAAFQDQFDLVAIQNR